SSDVPKQSAAAVAVEVGVGAGVGVAAWGCIFLSFSICVCGCVCCVSLWRAILCGSFSISAGGVFRLRMGLGVKDCLHWGQLTVSKSPSLAQKPLMQPMQSLCRRGIAAG